MSSLKNLERKRTARGAEGLNVRERARASAKAMRAYIEQQIAAQKLLVGDQIPTERALARQFSASRDIVRRALVELERKGLIERQVGRGSFVRSVPAPERGPSLPSYLLGGRGQADLELLKQAGPREVMELRVTLEPVVAELAVQRASSSEIDAIEHCLTRSLAAGPLNEFEHWDDMLHLSIAKASKNVLFVRIYEIVGDLRRQVEWGLLKERTLTPAQRQLHTREHEEIVQALKQRDAKTARAK